MFSHIMGVSGMIISMGAGTLFHTHTMTQDYNFLFAGVLTAIVGFSMNYLWVSGGFAPLEE